MNAPKPQLPFVSETKEPRLDITFGDAQLLVADVDLGAQLRDAASSSGIVRFGIALKLQKELRKVLTGIETEDPIYNIEVHRTDDEFFVAELSYLPGFACPSRIFRFSNWRKHGNALYLSEVWHASHPVLQPIDVFSFAERYRVRLDDLVGFRSAICEIISMRLESASIARESIRRWFSPKSETIIPEYDDDD